MAKVIDDVILKEYFDWLTSPKNNPSGKKFNSYDYCLNRLFEKAVDLNLITRKDVDDKIFDVSWLKDLLDKCKTDPDLKEFDEKRNQNCAGRASLTHFIRYVVQKVNPAGGASVADGEEEANMLEGTKKTSNNYDLNLILYGPPGTGKTYNTVNYAVAVIDGKDIEDVREEDHDEVLKRYKEFIKQDRIAFTTFHQSYGYEEFIEGIKPITDKGGVKYDVRPGVFKEFCERAKKHLKSDKGGRGTLAGTDLIKVNATVWKISLDSAGRKNFEFHNKCLEDDCIRVGWDSNEDLALVTDDGKDSARRFIEEMKIGDIVLSCYSSKEIDAIGVITGDYEWHDDEPRLKRFRNVKWLKKWTGKSKYNIISDNSGNALTQTTVYRLWRISVDKIKQILAAEQEAEISDKEQSNTISGDELPYVFIIDEINRGNISKIFGELITLIEPSKRLGNGEEMQCTLPYSGDKFGVPKNVYIIGTMNTADRSLVQLDAALRRRFEFEEMMPKPDRLITTSDGIDLNALLCEINKRITALSDREHQIGHSYFMKLDKNSDVSDVAKVFRKNIVPLLQEYFFDDYESIQNILGEKFIRKEQNPFSNGRNIYSVNISSDKDDYIRIYNSSTVTVENE